MIELTDVHKTLGGHDILRGMTFRVPDGMNYDAICSSLIEILNIIIHVCVHVCIHVCLCMLCAFM